MIRPITFQGLNNFDANLYALELKSRFINQAKADGFYTGYGNELNADVVGGESIVIHSGAFLVQGRMNEVVTDETVTSDVLTSGFVGYVVARIETYHPDDENNCEFIIKTGATFAAINATLANDNVYSKNSNTNNLAYELPIYSFSIVTGSITGLTKLIQPIADYQQAMTAINNALTATQAAQAAAETAQGNAEASQTAAETAQAAAEIAQAAAEAAEDAVIAGTGTRVYDPDNNLLSNAHIDNSVVENSLNLITSGGVFDFITNIYNLASSSWEIINALSTKGIANKFYNIGDEKQVELSGGEIITLVILGFKHDNLTSGGKAEITFGMKDCLLNGIVMNPTATNTGGWNATQMRLQTMQNLFSQLPAELQAIIKNVNKASLAGGGSSDIVVSSDKLFLLSEKEITNTIAEPRVNEGLQYEYWNTIKNGTVANDRIKTKTDGSSAVWWLRTPNETTQFATIASAGSITNWGADNNLRNVSFAFCI